MQIQGPVGPPGPKGDKGDPCPPAESRYAGYSNGQPLILGSEFVSGGGGAKEADTKYQVQLKMPNF
jgi:hypothetical protein